MRNRSWIVIVVLAVLCATSTVAKKSDAPDPDPQLGSIGVKIKAKGPTGISAPVHAVQVFFVKVEDVSNVLDLSEIVLSNFNRKKQVYLINVEPGKYVAVGTYAESNMDVPSANVYFDEETIAATEVTVAPGKITFMSNIVVKVKTGMKKADAAQNHFADILGRGIGFSAGANVDVGTGQSSSFLGVGHVTRAGSLTSIARDSATERTFLTGATEKAFSKEPAWQALARSQLATVN